MFDQNFLDDLFPATKTNEFFEALFGGAEDGAYDIALSFHDQSPDELVFHFDLHQRSGHCLRCNLTTGLPQVFQRHPIIGAQKIAEKIADQAGFEAVEWKLGATVQSTEDLHYIPFHIMRKK